MKTIIVQVTDGTLPSVMVERDGQRTVPASAEEWDKVSEALGAWVDETRMMAYYERQSKVKAAAAAQYAERRAYLVVRGWRCVGRIGGGGLDLWESGDPSDHNHYGGILAACHAAGMPGVEDEEPF
jgi:hypothetical protein